MRSKLYRLFFCLIFPLLLIFLVLNKHSRDGNDFYRTVLFADASGYYVYLPHWFISHDVEHFYTDSLLHRTGGGFVRGDDGKLRTKYTSGVAMLQLPFFAAAHIMAPVFGYEANGFSRIYYLAVMFAGIFYGWLGLLMLFLLLEKKFGEDISFFVACLLFAGTNLYWYMIDSGGMSHVYSFFLFSFFLYLGDSFFRKPALGKLILLSLIAWWIILVRPTNILFLPFVFFAGIARRSELRERWQSLGEYSWKLVAVMFLGALVWLPQLLYWKYISGSYIFYSYTGETFSNWAAPKIPEVLFSTRNGLFIYSPLLLLAMAGVFIQIKKKEIGGAAVLFLFLLLSYVCASWWDWSFGCAYGARSFVDLLPALAFPFAALLENLRSKPAMIAVALFVAVCLSLNMDIIYYYDGCYVGGLWDLNNYLRLLD